jgi:Carboxypeptidase regulatory-like domain
MRIRVITIVGIALALAMAMLWTTAAFAGLGKIAGTIKDAQSGQPLPGVNVTIVGTTMGASTDLNGQYFILNVPPGTYQLRASIIGYEPVFFSDVVSRLDVTITVDFQLKATVITGEAVTIVAERPIVDKTMTATKVTFDREELDNALPLTNLQQVLATSVTSAGMRGGIRRDVAYLLDGINITNKYMVDSSPYDKKDKDESGNDLEQNYTTVNLSQLEEVSVVAGTFGAEYYASGGAVNLATRSGGNKLSGKLFLRSSVEGLKNAGPSVYSEKDLYFRDRQALINAGDPASLARSANYTWQEGKYPYGKPTEDGELAIGGPLTSKGNFYLTSRLYNSHGTLPTEFRRELNTSLKVNYSLTPANKLTAYLVVDDGGKLLGWKNRTFQYTFAYYPAANPLNQKLGLLGYLKWVYNFDPSAFMEVTVAGQSDRRESGYVDPNNDGIIEYDQTGGDFIILDTKEKSKKYVPLDGTGWFHPDPVNDQSNVAPSFEQQIRIAKPAFYYDKINTDNLNLKADLVKQVTFNHQLKAGFSFNRSTIDRFYQYGGLSLAQINPDFPFSTTFFKVHPWDLGTYLQDRIEYKGIIVNAGIRLDAYNIKADKIANLFYPARLDTLASGVIVANWNRTQPTRTRKYFSPRLGISHPLTENSSMHYSWGFYTTPPSIAAIFATNYLVTTPYALQSTTDPDPDPARATAYEIGVQTVFLQDFGLDLTAFYRDTRNSGSAGYLYFPPAAPGRIVTQLGYSTSGGYSDSRGIELNVWRQPIGFFSGKLSFSYAFNKTSAGAGNLAVTPDQNQLTYPNDADYNFDNRFLWHTYSSGQNVASGRLTLLFKLPFDIQASTLTTYNSPWVFTPTLNISQQQQRYRPIKNGDYFLQSDLRITKMFKFSNMSASAFFEGRNIFDRLNILGFDTFLNNTLYEEKGIPWGPLNRPTDISGNPFAGIPRQLYAGVEFYF